MLDLGRGNIDIEHEGEMFRLWGDLTDAVFVTWISTIERLTPDMQTISLTNEKQLEVMNTVINYWTDEKLPIYFIDDNYNIISATHKKE